MEKLEEEWIEYPILHIDLNTKKYNSRTSIEEILNQHLEVWESLYGNEKSNRSPEERFTYIIRKAAEKTGRNVVILIDEYDKPMLQAIGNEELLNEYRSTLKAFYGTMKSCDKYIKFAILTGVTKFSKVSVFSDLNNLMDISLSRRFASLCGITEQELLRDLGEDIKVMAQKNDIGEEEMKDTLKKWYDGYHFADKSDDIYNTFSILNAFAEMQVGSYWFETGTPTFLVELLKKSNYDLQRFNKEMASSDSLGGIDSMYTNPVPILYQSGYLTIKEYDKEFRIYYLGFPNREVEEGFSRFILPFYASVENNNSMFEIKSFINDVRRGDIDSFMQRLQSFFADTTYELARELELHYQNVLFIVFKLLGFYTEAEYHTSNGRIDLVIKTDNYIYVMEFKPNGSAEDAMRQINEKGYALPFASDKRKVLKVGVNFNNNVRGIEKWVVEK